MQQKYLLTISNVFTMIRCYKCGFSNQLNATVCIKCRSSLVNEDADAAPDAAAESGSQSRKTVVIAANTEIPWEQQPSPMPAFRKPRFVNSQPEGAPAGSAQSAGAPTVRRVVSDRNACSLVALSPDDEKELRKINLPGTSVSLNRSILDPANNSISRGEHATIYMKDGNWYLRNSTAMKTTFIRVDEPVRLFDGDVLLVGDSLFKFKAAEPVKVDRSDD